MTEESLSASLEGSNDEPLDLRPLADLSERRLWGMLELAPDGMLMADGEGTILVVNRQIESIFGYDRGDLLGRKVEELIPDRMREMHIAHRQYYRDEPTARSMGSRLDLWAKRCDGTEFPVEVGLSPFSDAEGSAVVVSIRDISDRLAVDAHNILIQDTIDSIHDGVYMFTPDTLQFTYVNRGALERSGYSRAELLTMSPLDINAELSRDSFLELLRPLVHGERPRRTFRTQLRHENGSDYPVEIVLEYPERSHSSTERVFVAVVRDIADQTTAEHQLRTSEAAFRTAFDEAPVGMLTARLEPAGSCTVESVNRAFCEMLAVKAEDVIGADIDHLTHPDDITPIQSAPHQDVAHDQSAVEEKRYRRSDGSYIWSLLHSTTLDSGETPLLLAHVLDISDRRASEVERERQRHWLAGLSEIRTHLLEGHPIDSALTLICRHACAIGNAETATIGTEDATARHLDLRAAYPKIDGERAASPRRSINAAIRSAIDSQQTVASDDDHNLDPQAAEQAGPCLVAPLVAGSDISGVLLLSRSAGAEPFGDEEIQIVESFAHQAATAVEFARLRIDRERLGLLEDRERIAHDLHDLVIQRLFAAGMGLQSMASLVPTPAAERIRSTISEIDVAITELRSAIFSLSNPDEPKSVAGQLTDVVGAHHPRLGFEPTVHLGVNVETTPTIVVEQLLPTLNEALSNVERHANASAVEIHVELDEQFLIMRVSDDGTGIASQGLGTGLRNLERRAKRLGGSSTLENNEGSGAVLTWTVELAQSP